MTLHGESQGQPALRVKSIYALLILISLSIVSGRIATVVSREGDTAFLSANDRSRWCTIAALVETGSYEIDSYLEIRGAKQNRRPWYTIDLVRHVGRDGQLHYYSSKPPLLPTIYAGVYWCVSRTMQMWLSEHPLYLGRIILWLVNVPTFLLFLLCTIGAADRMVRSEYAKVFIAACVCFATMLLPFTIALNNHLPAAAATALVLYIFVRSMKRPMNDFWWGLAGLAAGFAAANELPALSMTVFWGCILVLIDRRATASFSIGVLIIAIAFFTTNWIAHQSLRPPYMHRGNGAAITQVGQSEATPDGIRDLLVQQGLADKSSTIEISPSRLPGRERIVVDQHRQYGWVTSESGAQLVHWDDWYDYPSSYWVDGKRRGVDVGEPSRLTYAFNMTFGHYGIFSLTPIWLLVPFGLSGCIGTGRAKGTTVNRSDCAAASDPGEPQTLGGSRDGGDRRSLKAILHNDCLRSPRCLHQMVLAAIALATAVCFAFYVMRPEIDRNYGGVSVCFRWLLWFAPLWIYASLGPVEWLSGRRWGRVLMVILLAASVFSVATALEGPWQPPWLYRFWSFLGWIAP